MRKILLFSALVLTACSAQAAVPNQAATPQRAPAASLRLCGSVWLQDRPLPGAVLHYPGILSPLRGPHGGLLARQQRGGWRQG